MNDFAEREDPLERYKVIDVEWDYSKNDMRLFDVAITIYPERSLLGPQKFLELWQTNEAGEFPIARHSEMETREAR